MSSEPTPGSGAEVISTRECRRLLGTEEVGRLGVVLDGRPEIFPVNYTVDGDGVLFRTADGAKLPTSITGRRIRPHPEKGG
jgi:nitroimidazol reductase NimA-like FMN-containing flavoprotein (pyridoxamine 5'-phosphate oxidase superfamily)